MEGQHPPIFLEHTYTGRINSAAYFTFKVQNTEDARILIKVSPGNGFFQLYGNKSLTLPSAEDYTWCVGVYDQETCEENDFFFTPDPSTYVNTNLFDRTLPRNFTRKPENDLNIPKNRKPSTESLVMCLGCDEWELTNYFGSLLLLNTGSDSLDFTIEKSEILENTLLSPLMSSIKSEFDLIFQDESAFAISKDEILRKKIVKCAPFVYGEIDLVAFSSVIELCRPQTGHTFWDLGCGAGKCLVATRLLYPRLNVFGVEYLEKLWEKCRENVMKLPHNRIELICGDLFEVDWSRADIVYCANLCFPEDLNARLMEKCKLLKKHSKIILLKRPPKLDGFKVLYNSRVRMSWGAAQVYVLEKLLL